MSSSPFPSSVVMKKIANITYVSCDKHVIKNLPPIAAHHTAVLIPDSIIVAATAAQDQNNSNNSNSNNGNNNSNNSNLNVSNNLNSYNNMVIFDGTGLGNSSSSGSKKSRVNSSNNDNSSNTSNNNGCQLYHYHIPTSQVLLPSASASASSSSSSSNDQQQQQQLSSIFSNSISMSKKFDQQVLKHPQGRKYRYHSIVINVNMNNNSCHPILVIFKSILDLHHYYTSTPQTLVFCYDFIAQTWLHHTEVPGLEQLNTILVGNQQYYGSGSGNIISTVMYDNNTSSNTIYIQLETGSIIYYRINSNNSSGSGGTVSITSINNNSSNKFSNYNNNSNNALRPDCAITGFTNTNSNSNYVKSKLQRIKLVKQVKRMIVKMKQSSQQQQQQQQASSNNNISNNLNNKLEKEEEVKHQLEIKQIDSILANTNNSTSSYSMIAFGGLDNTGKKKSNSGKSYICTRDLVLVEPSYTSIVNSIITSTINIGIVSTSSSNNNIFSGSTQLQAIDLVNFTTNNASITSDRPKKRKNSAIVVIHSRYVFIYGGTSCTRSYSDLWMIDLNDYYRYITSTMTSMTSKYNELVSAVQQQSNSNSGMDTMNQLTQLLVQLEQLEYQPPPISNLMTPIMHFELVSPTVCKPALHLTQFSTPILWDKSNNGVQDKIILVGGIQFGSKQNCAFIIDVKPLLLMASKRGHGIDKMKNGDDDTWFNVYMNPISCFNRHLLRFATSNSGSTLSQFCDMAVRFSY